MKKWTEIALIVLALVGMYCATSNSLAPIVNPASRTEHAVVVADGSDPMPLCRPGGRRCGK